MVLLTKTNRSEEMLKRMSNELQAHRYYYKAMNVLIRYIEHWDVGTLRGKLKAIDSRQQLHIHTEESLEPFYVIPKEVWYKDVA